jgi:putative ABC transport system ATP-binding protein
LSAAAIVRLVGVSKSFNSSTEAPLVLSGVNLTIVPGQKTSLVGPSGSGKSTLLSLIAGLLRPSQGSVEIDGIDMSTLDDTARARLRANRIGIALQSDNLIPFLTASENVQLAMAFVPGGSRRAAKARAQELLERFGVGSRARHRPRQLSGGEAQRVALAVAMANDPAVLLADEVVGQLDSQTAGQVIDDVMAAEFAVLFVTHDLVLADRADHRYTIRDGGVHPR